jgi:hypothetical protein
VARRKALRDCSFVADGGADRDMTTPRLSARCHPSWFEGKLSAKLGAFRSRDCESLAV